MQNTGEIQQTSTSLVIQGLELEDQQYQHLVCMHTRWIYLQTQAITCVGALQSINRWQRIADRHDP